MTIHTPPPMLPSEEVEILVGIEALTALIGECMSGLRQRQERAAKALSEEERAECAADVEFSRRVLSQLLTARHRDAQRIGLGERFPPTLD